MVFHDLAWATIAYLRYLNVTDNDGWLEIDQEKLRSRTSLVTWATTALSLAFILPLGHHLLATDSEANIENVNQTVIETMVLLVVIVIPYLLAFWFYFWIFRHARHVMAMENNSMIDDHVSSPRQRRSDDSLMVRCRNGGQPEEPMEAVSVIVDDSSDDDLIEIGESQCAKQVDLVNKLFESFLSHFSWNIEKYF